MKNIEQSFFPRIVWNEVKFLSFSNQVGELISRLYITLDVYRKEILIPIYKVGYLKSSSLFLSSEVRGEQVEKTIIATGCILLV